MIDPITALSINIADVSHRQKIDRDRSWNPVMDGDYESDQRVFIGFYAGDSPPMGDELEYDPTIPNREVFWVYKTNWTIQELRDGEITPAELFEELEEEQPNIEIAGLCKYVRNKTSE